VSNESKAELKTEPAEGTLEELRALVKRAESGDSGSLPRLRALLDGQFAGYVRVVNIEKQARDAIMQPLCGDNLMAKELVERDIDRVARDLAGERPTAIERLLADRAALCWHLVNHYERAYAQAGSISLNQGRYHQDRIDKAHRRYLSALKTLATVRKLALPAIQVNVAKNQVNVARS
jgi:hypothetical protein